MLRILFIAVMAFASPAAAEFLTCKLTTACTEPENCADSSFVVNFEAGQHLIVVPQSDREPPEVRRITVQVNAQEIDAIPMATTDGNLRGFWATLPSGTQHIMSVSPNGVARYTLNEPTAKAPNYYSGTCEVIA